MGNTNEIFEMKRIENMSEHMSNYVNRYLEMYCRETGISSDEAWFRVYPSKKSRFESPTFNKIQHFSPTLQDKIFEQSFGKNEFSAYAMDCESSLLILELWNDQGILDKLKTLDSENNGLNYCKLQRINGFNIKIPFVKDDKMLIYLQCDI